MGKILCYRCKQLQNKKIEVEVGQRLSYQYHNKRSEAWTIISGLALITLDGIEKI